MRLRAIEMGAIDGVAGDAPPLVLLHGLFGQAQNFGAVQKALATSRRVVALDLRNHGASPHDPAMGYATMAADVAETLEALHLPPVVLLGHSMGGKVAMMLALTRPALLTGLIVADIAPVSYPPFFRAYADAMAAIPLSPGLTRRQADAALAEAVPSPGTRAFLLQNLRLDSDPPAWRNGLSEITAALPTIEAAPDLPPGARFEPPVLVLSGENSDYVREEHQPLFRALFPAVRFTRIKGAGHWLHAEKPEDFVAAILAFLG